ncbi:MAG: AzlD domain-containing protein [Desulfomonilia bacterium]|jgi:branched-subunit amino acid transport protein
MTFDNYLLCVLGMGLVTFTPRWIPLAWLSTRDIPEIMKEWLRFIPACILSALVAPAIFLDASTGRFQMLQPRFLAAIPTLFFALKTRSLGGTVIVGMIVYWIMNKLI